MSLDNLDALLLEQLQDIYYAEKQLVKALPKMVKAAKHPDLKQAFADHAEETSAHVTRLEAVFESLGATTTATRCPAIEGLIQEAAEMMEEDGPEAILDAGLIACAQRVEHYEMAAYGNARTFAEMLGHQEVVGLLDATLSEEHNADRLLTEISSESILPSALAAGESMDGSVDENAVPRKSTRSGRSAPKGRAR